MSGRPRSTAVCIGRPAMADFAMIDGGTPMTMNVSLTPQLEDLVRKRVDSGRYTSASEVVREALRLLDAYEAVRESSLAKLRLNIEEGWKVVREGRVSDFNPEDVKRRGANDSRAQ